MKTTFSPNHLITSINFNYLSTSNKSIDFSIRKSQDQINEQKENISIKIIIPTFNFIHIIHPSRDTDLCYTAKTIKYYFEKNKFKYPL